MQLQICPGGFELKLSSKSEGEPTIVYTFLFMRLILKWPLRGFFMISNIFTKLTRLLSQDINIVRNS